MGCDIHIKCEIKRKDKWELNTDKVFPNPWYKEDSDSEWQKDEFQDTPDDNRNYDWFAILADVRNGRGFAGISTGSGFDVIAEPKGVPEDATEEWKKEVERWDCDMHSHSYLTLEEFDNFDWNQFTMKYGVISLKQYEGLKGTSESPESWCGATSGGNIITVNTDIADAILADPEIGLRIEEGKGLWREKVVTIDEENGKPASEFDVNVSYEWPVHYSEWFEHKIKNVVEPMRKLKETYGDVRIVFGFDN